MPDTPEPGIQVGQVYRSCDPRDQIRIRIAYYQPGWQRASVVDAASGKRHRKILVASLHASATTDKGTRRRTGYALDTTTNRSILNA